MVSELSLSWYNFFMYGGGILISTLFIFKKKLPLHSKILLDDISDTIVPLSLSSFLFSNILPNRAMSRIMGPLTEKRIPTKLRPLIYKLFGLIYNIKNWDEFKIDLKEYQSFKDFFSRSLENRRKLKPNDIVSPTDGTILTCGQIDKTDQNLKQIKGVNFKLNHFLNGYNQKHKQAISIESDIQHKLFYCIIYLSPGDYHRFHSCSDDISINCINHIIGDLYPVKPSWLKKIPGLFTLNERIVLSGKWTKHNLFFSYIPVGAFNVGSITLNYDDKIKTNHKDHDIDVKYRNNSKKNGNNRMKRSQSDSNISKLNYVKRFKKEAELKYNKGDEIGYFSFGSTVVLIFEAPNFKFHVKPNQKVKYGDALGDITWFDAKEPFI